MTLPSWSRLGLYLFVLGVLSAVTIRFIVPHLITDKTLANPEAVKAFADLWIIIGLICIMVAFAGIVLWGVAGLSNRKKEK